MRWILALCSWLGFLTISCGQKAPSDRPHCSDPAFDKKVASMLRFSVPLIGPAELKNIQGEVLIFDARKREEYEVSHIPGSRYIGFEDFDPSVLENIPKNSKIVLYCSIGYRSEKIGEKLKTLGYSRVFNLYGSLFEWANLGYPMVDKNGLPTRRIHTYNRDWSQWVKDDRAQKIW